MQKLVLFTEHRDTLHYLQDRIATLLGRAESVVVIHGGMDREDRHKVQEAFRHHPAVQVLLATDAAGEGINLQRGDRCGTSCSKPSAMASSQKFAPV